MNVAILQISQQIAFREPGLAKEEEAAARENSFTLLVERQSRFVFRIAFSILRNVQDSEDVTQETFLKLYRSRAWERPDNEKAFLARTTWRIAVDHLRKRKNGSSDASDSEVPCGLASPEQAALEGERDAIVHRLIDALPEELRQPLALSTVDELTSLEIAGILGLPEGTVRTRLMRARQLIRRKLAAWKGLST